MDDAQGSSVGGWQQRVRDLNRESTSAGENERRDRELQRKAEKRRALKEQQAELVRKNKKVERKKSFAAFAIMAPVVIIGAVLLWSSSGKETRPTPATSTRSAHDQEVIDIANECIGQGGTEDECIVGAVIVAGS